MLWVVFPVGSLIIAQPFSVRQLKIGPQVSISEFNPYIWVLLTVQSLDKLVVFLQQSSQMEEIIVRCQTDPTQIQL